LLPHFFVVGWVGIVLHLATAGWHTTWRGLEVPLVNPPSEIIAPIPFEDLRTIQGTIQSRRQGLNPQAENPGDPWGRALNYPSIWISIADLLRLENESNLLRFGVLSAGCFLLCLYLLIEASPSIWLVVATFSGATLLAIERGNNDLIIFTLLFITGHRTDAIGIAAFLVATLLKGYPMFVAPLYLNLKYQFLLILVFLGLIGIYLWGQYPFMTANTPVSTSLSYGSASLSLALTKFGISIPNLIITGSLVIAATALATTRLLAMPWSKLIASHPQGRQYIIGSLIYVASYSVTSNWDYRLIFILLCIPFLHSLSSRYIKYFSLCSVILAMNQLILTQLAGKAGLTINILAKLALFTLFAAILINTCRDWHNIFIGFVTGGVRQGQK